MIPYLYNYFLTRKLGGKGNRVARWWHWQLYKYLKNNLIKYYKKIPKATLGMDEQSSVIVSLTSFPARINLVHIAIKSLLNQSKRPKKIVLWLGDEFFPHGEKTLPKSLLELKQFGLEIEFCRDLGAHTKYFYAFQKYPNNLIVTVDDDIIYPRNLLKVLLNTHNLYPNCVIANRVRYMEFEGDNFKTYREWKVNNLENYGPSTKIFATGVGGVLYHPDFFLKSLFDVEGIKKTGCIGDDVWLKAGQIANEIPVVFTGFYFKRFIEIPDSQIENLHSTNVFNADNDRQIKNVFNYFKINVKSFE